GEKIASDFTAPECFGDSLAGLPGNTSTAAAWHLGPEIWGQRSGARAQGQRSWVQRSGGRDPGQAYLVELRAAGGPARTSRGGALGRSRQPQLTKSPSSPHKSAHDVADHTAAL